MTGSSPHDPPVAFRGPDFLCIGAQKAGTTWIHDRLRLHPDVWVPPTKELHYFDTVCPNEDLLGVEPYPHAGLLPKLRAFRNRPTYSTVRWLSKFARYSGTADWYRSLFTEAGTRLAGEFTPAYSTLDERGVRFARRVLKPGCKVFLVLRNPVNRTWSSFKMYCRWLEEDIALASPEVALEFAQDPRNRLRTQYPRIVELWGDRFDEDFRVFLFDDLLTSPVELINSICTFIGAKPFDPSDVTAEPSNPDPQDLTIPEEIREVLTDHFRDSILDLDRSVPGVAARWLT